MVGSHTLYSGKRRNSLFRFLGGSALLYFSPLLRYARKAKSCLCSFVGNFHTDFGFRIEKNGLKFRGQEKRDDEMTFQRPKEDLTLR